jgi:hypothetical protein
VKVLSLHKSVLTCLLLAALLLGVGDAARAQEGLAVHDVNVIYNFGEQITFEARLDDISTVRQASVLFRGANEQATRIEPLVIEADGRMHFTYDASLNVLPPFSNVVFWFQAAFTDGRTLTSPNFNFRYDDNRFAWQELSEGGLVVHWYEGDQAFGQAALDTARAGLSAVAQLVPLDLEAPVEVYLYSHPDDLQGALVLGGQDWVSGHADPALGVVMTAVTPGDMQSIEMQTGIPHELAHVMLYRELGEHYHLLPAWLREGLASLAELYPKADYANALQLASQDDALIPMGELCDSFPPDSGRAFLAYAQSQSFTAYLRDTYGSSGLSALVGAYGDGFDCELGASRGLGASLSDLDARWRESVLGQNLAGAALRNLLPYLMVLGLVLLIPLVGAVRMVAERRKYDRGSG